jgi:hypothetical protein
MNAIEGLKTARRNLQEQLNSAAPQEKPDLVFQIRALNDQIRIRNEELEACHLVEGTPALTTTFTGTATLTTTYPNPGAAGPFIYPVTLGVYFGPGRTQVIIISFPTIATTPYSTTFGENVTTVSKEKDSFAGGSFERESGSMRIKITLRFDHSIDVLIVDEDSTLPLLLGTGSVGTLQGSPLNRTTRELTLVGAGTFEKGILGGSTGTLVSTGTFLDLP